MAPAAARWGGLVTQASHGATTLDGLGIEPESQRACSFYIFEERLLGVSLEGLEKKQSMREVRAGYGC